MIPLSEPPAPAAPPAAACPSDPGPAFDLPSVGVAFPNAPGAPEITAEHALTDAHRTRGLMYRTTLEEDRGMLFSWTDARPRSFWMHSTCLSLDMLFIGSDGTIVGVLEQVPTLNDASRRIPCPAQHVLEVSAGWVRRHGVRPGQKLVISG